MVSNKDFLKAVHETPEGIVLDIMVRPNSRVAGLFGYNQWRKMLEFKVRSPASKGKANSELLNSMADIFKINAGNIVILSGSRSTNKKVLIKTITIRELSEILEEGLQ